ncbi:MAG: efflux RND transporter periplasmic adaptor subunit [Lentisphaerae bacterium]|nr:efflux RND transporter periplasmic adaptor subunit [Lentisphaerota bacterium]
MSANRKVILVVSALTAGALAFSVGRAVVRKARREETRSIEDIRKEQGVPVRTIPPLRTNLTAAVVLDGTVEPRERGYATAQVDERVKRILVDEGDRVAAGDEPTLLVELDDREALAARASAETAYDDARANFARAEALFKGGGISEKDRDQARVALAAAEARRVAAEKRLANCKVYAPIAGTVARRHTDPGAVTKMGEALIEIVDASSLKVEARAPEKAVPHLRAGMPCEITIGAEGNREPLRAEISALNPELDPVTRDLTVTCRLADPPEGVVPGMFARVRVRYREHKGVLAVPEEAEVQNAGHAGVYVVTADGIARFRPVEVGLRDNGWVEIVSGLRESETVIADGHRQLSDGARILVRD